MSKHWKEVEQADLKSNQYLARFYALATEYNVHPEQQNDWWFLERRLILAAEQIAFQRGNIAFYEMEGSKNKFAMFPKNYCKDRIIGCNLALDGLYTTMKYYENIQLQVLITESRLLTMRENKLFNEFEDLLQRKNFNNPVA